MQWNFGSDRVEVRTASWLAVNSLFVSSSLRVRAGMSGSRSGGGSGKGIIGGSVNGGRGVVTN